MKRILNLICLLMPLCMGATPWKEIPVAYKWTDNSKAVFSYDGSYTDAFGVDARSFKISQGLSAPEKYSDMPIHPEGAVNPTFSPDSTMIAFTRGGDLYVASVTDGQERKFTSDGGGTILNGYASWVYYEEIFGRPSKYRAFWWSPDSRKIAFYRFDETEVPIFPIYSAQGQDGSLRLTRYPKVGEPNPKVRVLIADLSDGSIVQADFDEYEDQYFGTPFWSPDGKWLYVSREPRIQNTLDLYRVSAADGSKQAIYHEESPTWLDWIDGMLFTDGGLYMVRSSASDWQQIWFLGYDGTLRRLTDGPNWRMELIATDGKNVYFKAERDSRVRQCLYRVDTNGRIAALSDTSLAVQTVKFSPDCKHFVATLSGYGTPTQIWMAETASAAKIPAGKPSKRNFKVADRAGEDFNPADWCLPEIVTMTTEDGFELPAAIVFPKDFDPTRRYPVHMDIYGGPDAPLVRERWTEPNAYNQWWPENGIIQITADCRAAGHNGRAGLDMIYKQLSVNEVGDFVQWAHWLQSKPWVQPDKIGVEGFSFGGTMTALLVFDHPDEFHYGIAGGGVYDWTLYDSHYTERFMETPATNPDGFPATRVISHAENYKTENVPSDGIEPVMLRLTHGTGDDNVHFQNTLQLIDELQRQGKKFELMIYPDGMHGYRGAQARHFLQGNREFWLKHLCGKQ